MSLGMVLNRIISLKKEIKIGKKFLKRVKIGHHKDVQVTTGHRSLGFERVIDPEQIIDQVFCAAVNIAQGASGRKNIKHPYCKEKCQFILEAAYTGTYLAAIKNERKHIFLTLIGGGAFGNPKSWIYKAILLAHKKWSRDKSSCLEKVTLVLFRASELDDGFLNKLAENSIPYEYWKYKKGEKKLFAHYEVPEDVHLVKKVKGDNSTKISNEEKKEEKVESCKSGKKPEKQSDKEEKKDEKVEEKEDISEITIESSDAE